MRRLCHEARERRVEPVPDLDLGALMGKRVQHEAEIFALEAFRSCHVRSV